MKKWLYDKLSETDKRLDFLTERSNKMAGEYEDLLATIQAERVQSVALQAAYAANKAASDAAIALLNQHIADLQAAGTTPGVGIVMSPEQFATLKANAAQVITDAEAAAAGIVNPPLNTAPVETNPVVVNPPVNTDPVDQNPVAGDAANLPVDTGGVGANPAGGGTDTGPAV